MPKKKAKKSSSSKKNIKKNKAKALAFKITIPAKLEKYLKQKKARYGLENHKIVYTAFDHAQTLKTDLTNIAKTLVVQSGPELILVMIPANHNLDFNALKKFLNLVRKKNELNPLKSLKLASEKLIAKKIIKTPGALPPFGELYKIWTVMDKALQRPKEIFLSGGSFTVSIVMKPKEFMRIVDPYLGSFGKKRK